jgi:hypothetical protein
MTGLERARGGDDVTGKTDLRRTLDGEQMVRITASAISSRL